MFDCLASGFFNSLERATAPHRFPRGRLPSIFVSHAIPVDRRRVLQRLVRALMIIAAEPFAQASPCRESVSVVVDVNILILYTAPEPLDEAVVDPASPPVIMDPKI